MFHQPPVNHDDAAATLDIHLVPVVLAANAEEAERCRIALEDDSIPVMVGEASAGGDGETPVLVPEAFYERASEILALMDVFVFDDWDDDKDHDEDDDDDDDSLPEDDDFDDDLDDDDEDSDDDFDE